MKRVAFALIRNEKGQYLMGKRRDSDKWSFIGGGCDNKENPRTSLIRETKEESGLRVTESRLVHVDKNEDVLIYIYEVSATGKLDFTKDPDQEFYILRYVNPFELVREMHVPAAKNSIMKWLSKK